VKRPIEKILIILNSLIGLIFIGSVVISKIPLFKLNILDKYFSLDFLNGWILISAYILAGIFLVISVLLIANRPKFSNNSIYVYGDVSAKVSSSDIKKIAKTIAKETEGVKSAKIEIQLGEFGNCLALNMKIQDGYDFQSLVAKMRPRLEEAITNSLGIKFPSYKFADGNVLFEFGAPYAGVGIDLETSEQKSETTLYEEPEKVDTLERVYEDPYDDLEQSIQKDIYPEVDFTPEQLDNIDERPVIEEEPLLEPEEYSIPYTDSTRKMGARESRPTEFEDIFGPKPAPKKTPSHYKSFEQDEFGQQEKQAPFQAAYENINREIQKQTISPTSSFDMREPSRSEKIAPQPQMPRQAQPNVQNIRQTQQQQQSLQSYEQQSRPAQQATQSAFRRPYPQRPMGVRPTTQSSSMPINQTATTAQQGVAGKRPSQRPSGTRISKEDIYAKINAILNKYSKLDDDNNQ
jgi:hypothetical protein